MSDMATSRKHGAQDQYAKGWEAGMRQDLVVVVQSSSTAQAVAKLETLMVEGARWSRRAASANTGRSDR